MRRKSFGLILGCVLLIAGCGSDGPSDTDVSAALMRYATDAQQRAQKALQAAKDIQETLMQEVDPKVAATAQAMQANADKVLKATSIAVVDKSKRSDGGYDVTVKLTEPDGPHQSVAQVTKTPAGWQVVDLRG